MEVKIILLSLKEDEYHLVIPAIRIVFIELSP